MHKFMIGCLCAIVFFIMSLNTIAGERAKAPPLPLHSIEGYGGILITGSAYIVNPAEEGKVSGLPSWGVNARKPGSWETPGSNHRIRGFMGPDRIRIRF